MYILRSNEIDCKGWFRFNYNTALKHDNDVNHIHNYDINLSKFYIGTCLINQEYLFQIVNLN